MDAGFAWQFELTAEALPLLRERLAWALQRQNQRFAQLSPAASLPVRTRQKAIFAVIPIGLLALGALYAMDRRIPSAHPILFFGVLAFFALSTLLGAFYGRAGEWSRAYAGRKIAQRAARLLRAAERNAPLLARYELFDARLHTRIEKLKLDLSLDLRNVGLALVSGPCVVLFTRKLALNPFRTIYASNEAERRAVLDALTRVGVPSEVLEGPVPGYSVAV